MIYWSSTKSPVHLFKLEYENPKLAAHVRENACIDPAILAVEARISAPCIRAYQRRLGVRPITGNGDKR